MSSNIEDDTNMLMRDGTPGGWAPSPSDRKNSSSSGRGLGTLCDSGSSGGRPKVMESSLTCECLLRVIN